MEEIRRQAELIEEERHRHRDFGKEAREPGKGESWVFPEFEGPAHIPGAEWYEDQGQKPADVWKWKCDGEGDVDRAVDFFAALPVVAVELLEIFDHHRKDDEVVVRGEGG